MLIFVLLLIAAIAVDFDIDEILKVLKLLMILTLALLKGRSFITQYDFESRDIVKSLNHLYIIL